MTNHLPPTSDPDTPTVYDIGAFHYDRETVTLSAEASSLGWEPGRYLLAFSIHNRATGNERLFGLKKSDETAWHYLDATGTVSCIVWND